MGNPTVNPSTDRPTTWLADDWTPEVEEYVRYDVSGHAPEIRSRADANAVYEDGRDLLVNAALVEDDLRSLTVPALLLHAPCGMLGQPPGLLPQPLVDQWVAQAPQLSAELVPDCNHYTILFAEQPASTVAARIVGVG